MSNNEENKNPKYPQIDKNKWRYISYILFLINFIKVFILTLYLHVHYYVFHRFSSLSLSQCKNRWSLNLHKYFLYWKRKRKYVALLFYRSPQIQQSLHFALIATRLNPIRFVFFFHMFFIASVKYTYFTYKKKQSVNILYIYRHCVIVHWI